jgi:hypothetical protein
MFSLANPEHREGSHFLPKSSSVYFFIALAAFSRSEYP